jgi:hypothetical protein
MADQREYTPNGRYWGEPASPGTLDPVAACFDNSNRWPFQIYQNEPPGQGG